MMSSNHKFTTKQLKEGLQPSALIHMKQGRSGSVAQSSCGRGEAVLAVTSGGIRLCRI
jgi:hypothetical protein